ncbi:hypothetical protein F2P56_029805 [Juglans regia]|uniref:Uncharacterized protein n=1 Tax=Juglans regia TaxID=51240 RepID=A0A833TJT9_JUGRE|nr:hypothetical protein F2P56_029805 [Juglans regia]
MWLLYRILKHPNKTLVGINVGINVGNCLLLVACFWAQAMTENLSNNGVLAVQQLRNNVMASTLLASTAKAYISHSPLDDKCAVNKLLQACKQPYQDALQEDVIRSALSDPWIYPHVAFLLCLGFHAMSWMPHLNLGGAVAVSDHDRLKDEELGRET